MTIQNALYTQYTRLLGKAADLNNAAAVLGWDQEVYMPAKSAEIRGQQLATLASMAHEIATSPQLEQIIEQLKNDATLTDEQSANIRVSADDLEKNKKLTPAFVEALSRQTSECFNAWIEARRQNDYKIYQPHLTRMIELKRQQAKMYGYIAHPYDALLDEYEKGATVAMLDHVFAGIRSTFPAILSRIKAATQVNNDCFLQHFPARGQWDFSMDVLKKMGYDLEAGRQDYAEHPFTTSFAPTDVRITTRVNEDNYSSLLWSTIHEGGHALYEQGLPVAQYGLPLGAAASLGIHESQSRFWENCIGRGRDFWQHFYPLLQQYFPLQLGNVPPDTFYRAMNMVEPSLIRTEADEVTYHFHVMIRYEIEKSVIDGSLNAADLPSAWNDMYDKYLGVRPTSDKEGILQDVHWSHGSFGYFPTYSLGSFYAAQFYEQAQKDIPGFQNLVSTGDFTTILQWLRDRVHRYGRQYTSEELCHRITGRGLDVESFLSYVAAKYNDIYA